MSCLFGVIYWYSALAASVVLEKKYSKLLKKCFVDVIIMKGAHVQWENLEYISKKEIPCLSKMISVHFMFFLALVTYTNINFSVIF